MKGLILSGGKGTRLRPLTYTNAKQLIPVANKPILYYAIETLVDAGITDIGIIVGDTHAEIEEAVGDGSRFGAAVTYIPQDQPLGLAHAVLTAEPFIQQDPFVMYLGDNLIKGGIREFVHQFETERPNALILLTKVKNPWEFGIAEMNDGKVARLVEKPKEPKSDLALVGVYLFDHHIFEAARAITPSFRNELEITDAIQHLITTGRTVKSHIVRGWWKDTGKLEDMLEANRMVLDLVERDIHPSAQVDGASEIHGKVAIGEGAVVEASVIRGPAVIGAGARITHAYIGPFTSIAAGCVVAGSEVEHSIVLEQSEILDVGIRIEDSLIGKGVKIYKSDSKPKAVRLMMGDHSQVGLI